MDSNYSYHLCDRHLLLCYLCDRHFTHAYTYPSCEPLSFDAYD